MRIFSVFKKETTPLGEQIRSYIEWASAMYVTAYGRKYVLEDFEAFCNKRKKNCISEVSTFDIEDYFKEVVSDRVCWKKLKAAESLRALLRFCRSKRIPCVHENFVYITHKDEVVFHYGIIDRNMPKKIWIGRPPNIDRIKKIKRMKDVGRLSFREIARAEKRDVQSVHRMYHYNIDQYNSVVGVK